MKIHTIVIYLSVVFFIASCKGHADLTNPPSLVGVYSNNAEGFKTVTLTLGRNGSGFLGGAVAAVPIRSWGYSSEDKTITIEGLMGDNHSSKSIVLQYNTTTKTLIGDNAPFEQKLKLANDERSQSFLKRWDKIANNDALLVAKQYTKTVKAADNEEFIITTMNTEASIILKSLKNRKFDLKTNDEFFAISYYSHNQMEFQIIQVRKEGDVWKIVDKK